MISSPLQLSGFPGLCGLHRQACWPVQDGHSPLRATSAMTSVCSVILFLIFSRNRERFRLSSLTSWKLTREVFCPLHTIPVVVLQPRKSACHSLMVPLSLTSQPLFRCVHWLQQKLPCALFLSKPYIVYFFMSHVLFFILDLPNSYQ